MEKYFSEKEIKVDQFTMKWVKIFNELFIPMEDTFACMRNTKNCISSQYLKKKQARMPSETKVTSSFLTYLAPYARPSTISDQ